MNTIKNFSFKTIDIPLREVFLITTAEKKVMRNVVVTIELKNGLKGFGEISPLFLTDEQDYQKIIKLLGEASKSMIGREIEDYETLIKHARRNFQDIHFALSGLEIAIYDALARIRNQALSQFFGGKKDHLDIDMTIGIMTPEETARLTKTFLAQGFTKIKMKVGLDVGQDIKKIELVADLFKRHDSGNPLEIYLDANQGYSLDDALLVLKNIEQKKLPVTLFEQPFKKDNIKAFQELTKTSSVPVAADETVASYQDALMVIEKKAAHVINIKLAKTGILAALDIMNAAKEAGLKLMIGGMLESKIGIAASVHLACGSDAFTYHDLDTIYLLSDYPVKGGFENHGPHYSVKGITAGTGILNHGV